MIKKYLIAFLVGVLFALGLGISGMTQPQKVIGFLDITGQWNPALAMVMVGAILVHATSFLFINKQASPILGGEFQIPKNKSIDLKLILGAILFGIGWGLAGLCPGPGIVSVVSGNLSSVIFVLSMVFGMFCFRGFQYFTERK